VDRLRLGLALFALAPLAWILGLVLQGGTDGLPGLLVILAGAGLAAWALPARRIPGAAGFALAAVGIALFYQGDFVGGLSNAAGGLFLLGCLAAAVGVGLERGRVEAAGLLAMALAGLLWVISDGVGGWTWQPGNLLACVGPAVAATKAWQD
jgi:hypothetical protein